MATRTELYIDTLGGLDLDGSTDKTLPYFVVENLATLTDPELKRSEVRVRFMVRAIGMGERRQCDCTLHTVVTDYVAS